jgi:flagellar protein FlaG
MNIGPLPAATTTARTEPRTNPDSAAVEQAAKNRELAKAIRALNENAVFGPGSEVRFAVDQETGRRLIRIVDRVTNEVLHQYPTDEVLRMARELRELEGHGWLA